MDPGSIGLATTFEYFRKANVPCDMRISGGQIILSVNNQNRNFTSGADAANWLSQQTLPQAQEGATHGGATV